MHPWRAEKLRGSERRSGLQEGNAITELHVPEKPRQIGLYRLCLYRAAESARAPVTFD